MIKRTIHYLQRKIMWPLLSNGVYCFNYHRIGDEDKCLFDPNVFSCTAEQFEEHIVFYNQEFTVISIEQLIAKIEANLAIDKKYAIVTFDDGYIDNYTVAYPILKKYQTPAAFYITTDYLDEPHIPWWDEIAWLIRHSKVNSIQLKGWNEAIDISTGSIANKVRAVLRVIKLEQEHTMADKIAELTNVCQCSMPDELRNTPLFISWEHAEEMSNNGMHIGSHTLSHTILSHLPEAVQANEIMKSKIRIEEKLSKEVTSIAYPVGGKTAFTETTQKLAKESNYKLAFSFIPGVIHSFDKSERFQLNRLPVDGNCTVKQLINIIIRNK
jgi:peptidoglycan/xylan/chitin deacetylase (PgdA/CDA1 family)